jgi:hypothetical protein
MPLWCQHLLVIALVLGAGFVVVRQAIGTLRLRHGKLGSCCAKGCDANKPPADSSKRSAGERIVFLPVESLARRRRQ